MRVSEALIKCVCVLKQRFASVHGRASFNLKPVRTPSEQCHQSVSIAITIHLLLVCLATLKIHSQDQRTLKKSHFNEFTSSLPLTSLEFFMSPHCLYDL